MTPPALRWTPLPVACDGSGGAVHVVRIHISETRHVVPDLAAVLSEAERERAARFRLEADRERYTVARGALRLLISRALGAAVAPSEVTLGRREWGKPAVVGHPELGINVSHAGDVVLIALAWGREVGVDVEHDRPGVPVEDLVPAALGEAERTWWASLPPCQRRGAFFALWTRKEAIVKAVGTGLGQTDVPWSPPTDVDEVLTAGRAWTVRRFEAAPSYPAAVAASGTGWPLHTWAFRPSR